MASDTRLRTLPKRTLLSGEEEARLESEDRRAFLRKSAAMAGGALAVGSVASTARGAPLAVPPSGQEMGRPIPPAMYGMPSKYEAHVARRRTDVFVNRQNWSDWSMTPLQHQYGIVTPNGVIFERHHAGTPDIDPKTHQLVIHGMVRQPLVFSMADLMRYPAVSRFYFLECSGNGLANWVNNNSVTVQQSHGLLSGAQWTGIPVSWLLDEAGVQPGAKWIAFEGADGSNHTRSMPIEKVLDDCLLVYASNGEMLRPENGYPLRLLVPGWEGNVSVKWLRRIKVGDQPWHFRSETARYTDPMPQGKWRQFSFEMECKSVITRPSGGMKLGAPGWYEIQGLAWSGNGRITAVDVTLDGGRSWQEATLDQPVLDKSLTEFRFRWNWNGGPATIASRAVDSTGYVQPTAADLTKVRAIVGFVQHHNGIQPWAVAGNGEVRNAIAG
jgi:sulfane dehydrogenase subunit SoxC